MLQWNEFEKKKIYIDVKYITFDGNTMVNRQRNYNLLVLILHNMVVQVMIITNDFVSHFYRDFY